MAAILQLARYRDPTIGNFLRSLADLSDHGLCPGVAVAWRAERQDQVALLGAYRECPSMAAGAAARLNWCLAQMQNDIG